LAASLITAETCNGWSKAKVGLDRTIAISRGGEGDPRPLPPWTLHDLRRTYATNLQRLGVKLEVIEALLNHVSGTRAGIVGVYQRHAYEGEMREAVETFEVWFQRTILAGGGLSKEE
jgi:integrase